METEKTILKAVEPDSQVITRNVAVPQEFVSAYQQIAESLTEAGLGNYKVYEAAIQQNKLGMPLSNFGLKAVTFEGQKYWDSFWSITFKAQIAINERNGQSDEDINKTIQAFIQTGIEEEKQKLQPNQTLPTKLNTE